MNKSFWVIFVAACVSVMPVQPALAQNWCNLGQEVLLEVNTAIGISGGDGSPGDPDGPSGVTGGFVCADVIVNGQPVDSFAMYVPPFEIVGGVPFQFSLNARSPTLGSYSAVLTFDRYEYIGNVDIYDVFNLFGPRPGGGEQLITFYLGRDGSNDDGGLYFLTGGGVVIPTAVFAVPEPSTFCLLVIGSCVLVRAARRNHLHA